MTARHSVRLRLALWHTGALALLLAAFAAGSYVYLMHTTRQRVDRSLAETARLFIQSWADEFAEQPRIIPAAAAQDAMHAVRYRDRRVVVYDYAGRLIALSDSAPLTPLFHPATLQMAAASPVRDVVAQARPGAPAITVLGEGDDLVRAYAAAARFGERRFTVVVLRELRIEQEIGETFLGWAFAAIPLALVLSGVGGYLLARASLGPVVTMARQAEQIGASSLHARLAVPNPHDELGQLAGVLNRLLTRLEGSFDQQRQFMADASHELRTPVAIVRSAADVALGSDSPTTDELRRTLQVVSGEGRRLTRIVDDLFLLARADAGQLSLRLENLYLEEVLTDTVRAARALAAPHGITMEYEPAEESPLHGDSSLLVRLLMNLVENAIKHTPRGGHVRLALGVVRDPVRADGAAAPGPWYRIAVEDTGIGVPDGVRETLFERFVRADSERGHDVRSVTGGAGLGLAIARWIAEAHGGRVVLEATGPTGSRFVAWLPVTTPRRTGDVTMQDGTRVL